MSKKQRISKNKGFTLIELVIVIGILAVLAAVTIRAFSGQGEGARNSQHMSYLSQLEAAATQYLSEYGKGDLATLTEVDDAHALVKLGFIKEPKNPWANTSEAWKEYTYKVGVIDVTTTVGEVTKTMPRVIVMLSDGVTKGTDNYVQMTDNLPGTATIPADASGENGYTLIENIK